MVGVKNRTYDKNEEEGTKVNLKNGEELTEASKKEETKVFRPEAKVNSVDILNEDKTKKEKIDIRKEDDVLAEVSENTTSVKIHVDQEDSRIPDALLRVLKEVNLEKLVSAGLGQLTGGTLVYADLMETTRQENLSLWTMDTPTTVPHFYQLCTRRDGTMGTTAGGIDAVRMVTTLSFLRPMMKSWGQGLDLIYARINTNTPGFKCLIDPFDLENCSIEAGGIEAKSLTIGLHPTAGHITYDEFQTPKQLFDIVLAFVGVAGRIGRYILLGKKDDVPHLFKEKCPDVHPEPLERFTGYLCNDDYETYPHVPEVLQIAHTYEWFKRELRDGWVGPPLGTSGEIAELENQRKISQMCIANVDLSLHDVTLM